MKIGHTFLRSGQRYWFLGEREHWTRDGHRLMLLAFRSRCADCGAAFHCLTTKTRFRLGDSLNRRCDEHKAPGVRVPKPGRRLPRAKVSDGTAPRPRVATPTATPAFLD